MASTVAGIVHNAGIPGGPRIHLPLEQMAAHVLILDVSSRTTLTQRYYNPSDLPTSRALYCFPVPARAAVCSFELRTASGKVLSGVCKEKSLAKEEHEQAVANGEYTALLEWVSNDTFTISIGTIPPKEIVDVKLIYVMNLMNDRDRDFLRFYLPMSIGQRYGPIQEGLANASLPGSLTRIRLKIDVQTSGQIQSISSPTHTVVIKKYNNHLGRASRRRCSIRFRSNTFLANDFVLLVQAEKLDTPRCFAEIYRDKKKQAHDTLAVQLTLVPRFDLPPIKSQEYIFLVDRSSSMNGNRIESAKKTLILLLRMLPTYESIFNIFSFGSHVDSLWSIGNQYNQSSLDNATGHIEAMSADYGGTEIFLALERVIKWRQTTIPTALFVLTDGEATNVDETVELVRSAVQGAPPSAPLRVYTLGIGRQVSTAMCEGIAEAGRGTCLFSTRAEDITAKCARLLRAGRTPIVKNVTVDWGIPSKYLVSPSSSTASVNQITLPNLQQAPALIHDLHADVRLVIFALFQLRKPFSPKEVTIRGQVEETGERFRLVVPIRGVQLIDPDPHIPIIHTLAASALIREHEARRAPLPLSVSASDPESRKKAIISLGIKYQLATRHTSFVANEKNSRVSSKPDRSRGLLGTLQGILATADPPLDSASMADYPIPGGFPSSAGTFSRANSQAGSTPRQGRIVGNNDSDDTADSYSTMSSLDGSSASSYWTETDFSRDEDPDLKRSPSPQFGFLPISKRGALEELEDPATSSNFFPTTVMPDQVSDLLTLQKADGSFSLDGSMKLVVGEQAVDEGVLLGVPPTTWATVLCIAFLEKHLAGQTELKNDLSIKAFEYLAAQGTVGVHVLIQHAKDLLL